VAADDGQEDPDLGSGGGTSLGAKIIKAIKMPKITTDDLGRHLEPFDVLKRRNKKGSKLRQAEVYTPL